MQLRDYAASSKPAVILYHSGVAVSFADLEASANRLAQFLRRSGLAAGDTVAVLMENNEHIHAAMWAAKRSGLYYTLVNTHLNHSEIAYIVEDSGDSEPILCFWAWIMPTASVPADPRRPGW